MSNIMKLILICLLLASCGSNEQSEGPSSVVFVHPECENATLGRAWGGESCNAKEVK